MRTCYIASPLATQSGYGHHAREIVTNIIEQKSKDWDIKLLSMPWGGTPMSFPLPQEMISKFIPLPLKEQPDIWIQVSVPNEFQPVGKYNIGFTAVTEGDICPKEWIESINRMQLIVVPSIFSKSVLEETAKRNNITITTTIEVVSEYFNDEIYCKPKDSLSILDNIHESFCYLFVGHWLQGQLGEDRKNITGLIHTFLETFKNKQSMPALILKTSGATYSITDKTRLEKHINELKDLHGKNTKLPNIYLLHGDLSDHEMNQLYNHKKIKAMVSFTKSEGFGRPLLEFATTGKPIIAPYYSGQVDFLLKDSIIEVPGGLTEIHPSARNQFLIEGAKWFSPDYGHAKKIFRETFKHYNKFSSIGHKQKKHVYTNFTKSAISKQYTKILSIVEESTNSIPVQEKLKLPKLNLPNLNKDKDTKIDLPNIKENKNPNLNDMAISDETLEWFDKNLAPGSTILEFGSGTGTIELTKKWKVYSVEQDEKYIGVAKDSNYIHAPIVNGWYNSDIVFSKIPKNYDFILVDGPGGSHYRTGIDKYWDKLNTDVPMIFDDTHRKADRDHAIEVANQLGKEWYEVKGWQKNFIVLKETKKANITKSNKNIKLPKLSKV